MSMLPDLGLLFLRITFGLTMLLAHGMPKLLGFSQKMEVFPDPLGLGSSLSLGLAIFAEVLCALLVTLGYFTRIAALPLIITMVVAVLIVHGNHPWGKMELGFLYGMAYFSIALTGPGKWSLDYLIRKKA